MRLDEADRLCQVCSNNAVEHEFHFLFECDEYTAYRSVLETAIGINFSDLSVQEKFLIRFFRFLIIHTVLEDT